MPRWSLAVGLSMALFIASIAMLPPLAVKSRTIDEANQGTSQVPSVSAMADQTSDLDPSCPDLPSGNDLPTFIALMEVYRNVGSTQGRLAQDAYNAIRYGRDDLQTFRIGGQVYTPALLNAMTAEERTEVAEEWLAWNGSGQVRQEQYAAQAEFIAAHPVIAGIVEFQDQAIHYPGGTLRFTTDLAKINPAYREFLTDLSQAHDPGRDIWIEKATSVEAYLIASGGADESTRESCPPGTSRALLNPSYRDLGRR